MGEERERVTDAPDEDAAGAGDDISSILSRLAGSGQDDYVTRVMEVYEAAERSYRAAQQAGARTIGASATTTV